VYTFKRKSLCAALVGVPALGMTGPVDAVNVSGDGLGQVLIYPYYTARENGSNNAFNTLLSVVNHTGLAKAVRVRFLEGRNGREVFDFNLFLSPLDVWTAAIVPESAGGAKILTSDKSCTIPAIPAAGQVFNNFAYLSDGGGSSLDRTREGHFEIIEMGAFAPTTRTASNVTHVNGVPPGCPGGVNVVSMNDQQAAADISPLLGGMSGSATVINVLAGSEGALNATVLDNFYTTGSDYQSSGFTTPDLTQAAPPISVVIAGSNGVYQSTWGAGTADAVSAVLMHDSLLNEYVLDSGTNSGTDWVVTFPTKHFYINRGSGSAPKLFQRNFNATAGSCDDFKWTDYDREENLTCPSLADCGIDLGPNPPDPVYQVCSETNVITFNNSNVLASTNTANSPITTPFQHGWLRINYFPSAVVGAAHTLANATNTSVLSVAGVLGNALSRTYYGLPTVGAMIQTYQNGTNVVSGVAVLQNYAGAFPHRYTTRIQ
jgi:hypothetical protein